MDWATTSNNTFDQERKRRYPKKLVAENRPYNADTDTFTCPAVGSHIEKQRLSHARGYLTERRVYESEDCSACELRPVHKNKEVTAKYG